MKTPEYYTPNWFSNMMPMEEPLIYKGVAYRTVEHFFQAMKTMDDNLRKEIAEKKSPYTAKQYWRNNGNKIRSDWKNIRLDVMEYALRHKFKVFTVYCKMLLDTEDHEIVEWNVWSDTFWGKDIRTGEGENNLGKLLMKIRTDLKKELGYR